MLGLAQINSLVAQANNQIQIIPAAGINENNIIEIAKETKAINFHCSLSEAVPSKMEHSTSLDLGFQLMESSSERITKLKNALAQYYHA
jgi:copper homeostasis protein CutC